MTTTGHNGQTTTREEFAGKEVTALAETQTTALAEGAKAQVFARYTMALQRPRSWDQVRVRLLGECKRRGFAETARYQKPIGKNPDKWPRGPSIRFAEAALRYAGNMSASTSTTYEDRSKRILHVIVTDFETNAHMEADITIEKTVERRNSDGRVVVAQRTNSYGDTVFIVESTEDDLLNKQNALVSKAVRTLVLRLIPGDIVDECMEACVATLASAAAKDPAGEKKRVIDAFASVGVMPADLQRYLGHTLDVIGPAELVSLREIYSTLRDGETTWADVVEAKVGPKKDGADPVVAAADQATNIAAKVKARRGAKASPAAADEQQSVATPHDPTTGEVTDADAATAAAIDRGDMAESDNADEGP